MLARQRGNLPVVAEEARRLQALAEAPEVAQHDLAAAARAGLGQELRALALISLGSAEVWAARFEDAERHVEQGLALARQIGQPFLEFTGLVYKAAIECVTSYARAAEGCGQALELAERHGWTDEPAAGFACTTLGSVLAWQGRLEEAEPWIQRAERALREETEPAEVLNIRNVRGVFELARGRDADALAAFQAADRAAGRLAEPSVLVLPNRSFLVQTLVRMGETERAEQALAGLSDQDRGRGEMRVSLAMLRLAQDDPHEAIAALAPVLDGSAPLPWPAWLTQAFLLEAIAQDRLGDQCAAETAVERALRQAEPDGVLTMFLLYPAPGLVERHARCRTAHAALIADIQSMLSAGPAGSGGMASPQQRGSLGGSSPRLAEPLRDSELRVLRYLPTNLTLPEIARELRVSHNTVKTHIRSLYTQLGAHRRGEAVDRARALGLLAPVAHRH